LTGESPPPTEQDLIAASINLKDTVGVHRVDSAVEMAEITTNLPATVRHEACTMLPGGPYPVSYLQQSREADFALLERGVRCLGLYQADAIREPGVLRLLSEYVARGAQVRVAQRVTHRILIIDRTTVFVAVTEDQLTLPFLVIREPALVRMFHTSFAQAWRSSRSVGLGPEDSIAVDNVGETMAILQSGVTDEVAALRLGISVRTVRRRVATVMELLGASSRFEAGVKAVKAGWI
jgi:hypothetical protein